MPLARDSVAVRFDDERYDVADLVLLALAEGHWQRLEARLARGLALERDHGRELAPARVTAEVKRFRYARRLISGKELRAWLSDRALTLEDVRRHCLRTLLIADHGERGAGVEPDAAEIDAEAIVSGTLGRAAARLGDLAAMAGAGLAAPDTSGLLDAVAAHPHAGLSALPDLEARAGRILRLLASEPAFTERTTTPQAVARCFAEHGIDWLRVECAELTLAREGAAREAMLCLRVDGTSLRDLARDLDATPRTRELYVSDVPNGLGPVLASAAIGDPVGPFPTDEGWTVLVVNERVAPTAADPELSRRATAAIVTRARERVKAGRMHELAAL
jgi:hypothetical protein